MEGFTDEDIEIFNYTYLDLKKKNCSIYSFKKGQIDDREIEICFVENEDKDSKDLRIRKYQIFSGNYNNK